MSLYHVVFALLFLGVIIEYRKKSTPKGYFCVLFFVLTLMMAIRFGQGTDYYSYCSIYTTMPLNVQGILTYNFAESEIGWRFLCAAFKLLGFSFKGFVFLLSLLEMFLFWRFLSRYCKYYMLALFLSYHTLYLTYYFSAMRQALVIALFLGVFLEWLQQGKFGQYCVGVLICSTFHTVALILLLPVFTRMARVTFSKMVCATILGCLIGVCLSVINIGQILLRTGFAALAEAYLGNTNISVVALMERVLSYIIVTYACYLYFDGKEPDQSDRILNIFKIYSMGMMIYGLLMWSPLISSRAVYMFKIMEIPLLCTCITKCKRAKPVILLYCLFICSMLYFKNIGSYVVQGYYQDFSVINYPYVSIFDHEKIAEYRKDTGFRIDWLEFDFDLEYVGYLKFVYRNLKK